MRKEKSVYVMLAGGLGNQLFQLAGALSRGSDYCKLDVSLANPRLNPSGHVDISDFELGQSVTLFKSVKRHRFTSRAANIVLRSGMDPKFFERWRVYRSTFNALTSFLISLRVRESVRVVQATDNGYFAMTPSDRNEFLIGYFQSYKWVNLESAYKTMHSLKLKENSPLLNEFLIEEKGVNSALMHVRLGDYKLETDFGIPSLEYYAKSLGELKDAVSFERIWLFSDEPTEAIKYVPKSFQNLVRIVPNFNGSSAITLEAMRHANSYIIANSSLSWWGARLSYTNEPLVVAPFPWFKSKAEPRYIIPEHWRRISAWK